ncbi:MAG TPA: type I 3-dehydroquinate dehydratase [Desulfatiglandales bacterium]|nr:type I 3-dehydroquinate dehydratase [Desulfatiglandales bacterium]
MFCVPIISKNTEEALEIMERVAPMADVLEIRLDLMERFDLHEIISAAPKPVIITYRSKEDGGNGLADPEIHADYIFTAIKEGADFVDVESSLPIRFQERIFQTKGRSKIIISKHISDNTPPVEELEKIFEFLAGTGAHIVKIVTRAITWEDNFRVLSLISNARKLGLEIIAFCMGPMGKISRIFSCLMGGYLTFASLEEGKESADGQIPIREMRKVVDILSILR